MSQNIKPLFLLPKEKIIDCEELKSKAKPLVSMLKAPNKIVINRKDLNPNWD